MHNAILLTIGILRALVYTVLLLPLTAGMIVVWLGACIVHGCQFVADRMR